MSDTAERQLIELVSREQRGLRRILVAGITTLVLVVVMSAALGVYYYYMAADLYEKSEQLQTDARRLDQQAFDMRRSIDAQTNRVAAQEAAIRRAYDEIRQTYSGSVRETTQDALLSAVTVYLQRGRHSLQDERLIESQAALSGDGAAGALLKGAANLLVWQRSGATITKDTEGLPEVLQAAQEAFVAAAADPAFKALADTGLAWVAFIDASSERHAYAISQCEAVNARVSSIASDETLGLQPLYWRAQCNRKMGRTVEALRDYSLAIMKIDSASNEPADADELTLHMNAYHGLGTVLITTAGLADDPDITAARTLAERMCAAAGAGTGSALMQLTRACLGKAIDIRQAIGQTPNQRSGSAENISFTYLRDGDFSAALRNATAVEETGLFAWNELLRALSAEKAGAADVSEEARRNVSMFGANQFNLCELKVLLTPELYADAIALISKEHGGVEVECKAN
jgi:hypothetical protein